MVFCLGVWSGDSTGGAEENHVPACSSEGHDETMLPLLEIVQLLAEGDVAPAAIELIGILAQSQHSVSVVRSALLSLIALAGKSQLASIERALGRHRGRRKEAAGALGVGFDDNSHPVQQQRTTTQVNLVEDGRVKRQVEAWETAVASVASPSTLQQPVQKRTREQDALPVVDAERAMHNASRSLPKQLSQVSLDGLKVEADENHEEGSVLENEDRDDHGNKQFTTSYVLKSLSDHDHALEFYCLPDGLDSVMLEYLGRQFGELTLASVFRDPQANEDVLRGSLRFRDPQDAMRAADAVDQGAFFPMNWNVDPEGRQLLMTKLPISYRIMINRLPEVFNHPTKLTTIASLHGPLSGKVQVYQHGPCHVGLIEYKDVNDAKSAMAALVDGVFFSMHKSNEPKDSAASSSNDAHVVIPGASVVLKQADFCDKNASGDQDRSSNRSSSSTSRVSKEFQAHRRELDQVKEECKEYTTEEQFKPAEIHCAANPLSVDRPEPPSPRQVDSTQKFEYASETLRGIGVGSSGMCEPAPKIQDPQAILRNYLLNRTQYHYHKNSKRLMTEVTTKTKMRLITESGAEGEVNDSMTRA